ncbi:MAG: SPOR domain-containing protein [Ignavibacteriaceae bacterium]|jgi:cell division septation protein DedD
MTRTELVKKLTSYALVDESYAAAFMESFLLSLHQQLLKYEAFQLPNNISFKQKKIVRNNREFYLITCSSSDQLEPSSDELIFAVPGIHDDTKPDKYSVFSISIGKQIIPNKELISSGFTFEPSFSLKNYCREKASSLIQKGEFVSPSLAPADFAWDFSPTETEDHFATDDSLQEEISKEVQEFSWDFGTNWKRELQEDEILSVQPSLEDVVRHTVVEENIEEKTEEEFPSWNFSEAELNDVDSFQEDVGTKTKIDELDFSQLHEKLAGKYEFEEVKAKDVTQELSIDLSDFDKPADVDLPVDETDIEAPVDDFLKNYDKVTDDEYVHVQSTSEFVLTREQEKLLEETDPFSSFTVERPTPQFEESTAEENWEPELPTFPLEKKEELSELFTDDEKEEEQLKAKKEKGSKFWTAASVILFAVIIAVVYWKMWGIPTFMKMGETENQTVKSKPAVIEREYDVPVTYPYDVKVTESLKTESALEGVNRNKVNSDALQETDKLPVVKNDFDASEIFSKNNPRNRVSGKTIPNQESAKTSKIQPPIVKETIKKTEVSPTTPVETKKATLIRDNIYLEGSTYVVQLSSWKSESIADQEVARLKRKGFKAYKTSAVVPQKGGTWYRVKVGGFSSAEEASRFYNSNK